jgi:EamA domain-containing membrane protein RarD
MAEITKIGIFFVHLALIFYTLFIIFESKKQRTTNSILLLLTLAVLFDITATTCMMIGTTRTYFTFHGIMGYIGLLMMIIDFILLLRFRIKFGTDTLISKPLNLYSKIAYYWWLTAFITGVIVSIFRH